MDKLFVRSNHRKRYINYQNSIRKRKLQKTFNLIICLLLIIISFKIFNNKQDVQADNKPVKTVNNSPKPPPTKPPIKVGIQIGHLDMADVPDELHNISWDFGAEFNGVTELSVNTNIGNQVANLLRKSGVEVDVLSATVPAGYTADAFVSIHADGLNETYVSGFEVGASSFDTTNKSATLAQEIDRAFEDKTKLTFYPAISDNMTQYYAFNFNKFKAAISSTTPAVLIECGFLSNSDDRIFLAKHSDLAAQGIANGVMDFINNRPVTGLTYQTSTTEEGQANNIESQ